MPHITFTATAWLKQMWLTYHSTVEIACHGVVSRGEIPGTYLIEDILVYPQKISAAHVESTDDYPVWLQDLDDDTFNRLRYQYHSHVNMPTGASITDTNFYEAMTPSIKDFYIFCIGNKTNSFNFFVYDVAQNVIFEHADIKWDVQFDDGVSLGAWLTKNTALCEEQKFGTAATYAQYNRAGGIARDNYSYGGSRGYFDDEDNYQDYITYAEQRAVTGTAVKQLVKEHAINDMTEEEFNQYCKEQADLEAEAYIRSSKQTKKVTPISKKGRHR